MMLYYDRSGSPISSEQWGKLHADLEYRRIALTKFDGGKISTVWLGLDHSWGEGAPIIFETMIFSDIVQLDGYQKRYHTEDAARAGHDRIVYRLLHGKLGELFNVHDT